MNAEQGLAVATIDYHYLAWKLPFCSWSDAMFGIDESNVFSSVRALKLLYAVRRPYFVMADDAFRLAFPSPAEKAIIGVRESWGGRHCVIDVNAPHWKEAPNAVVAA